MTTETHLNIKIVIKNKNIIKIFDMFLLKRIFI